MTKKHLRIFCRRMCRRFMRMIEREVEIMTRFYGPEYSDDAFYGDNLPDIG
jgi:hypothetical protein